jgi:hypothetical protein
MVIPHFNRPYEPDIVLFDKERNLYIDIEIDEPYDGYYRYPTHNLNSEGIKSKTKPEICFSRKADGSL